MKNQNSNLLAIIGVAIVAILVFVIQNQGNKDPDRTITIPDSDTPKTPAQQPVSTNDYSRYKWKVSANTVLKTKVNGTVRIRMGASTSAQIITSLPNNLIIGRATGNTKDANGFRWVEVVLSPEVDYVSSIRKALSDKKVNKFWIAQDYVTPVNVTPIPYIPIWW